jgi:hypothetical protein
VLEDEYMMARRDAGTRQRRDGTDGMIKETWE